MAQSVEYLTLDLSSGLDLVRSGHTVGLCAVLGAYERERERERELGSWMKYSQARMHPKGVAFSIL